MNRLKLQNSGRKAQQILKSSQRKKANPLSTTTVFQKPLSTNLETQRTNKKKKRRSKQPICARRLTYRDRRGSSMICLLFSSVLLGCIQFFQRALRLVLHFLYDKRAQLSTHAQKVLIYRKPISCAYNIFAFCTFFATLTAFSFVCFSP